MQTIALIAAKEFKSYLTSPMAYIVTGIFLILTGTFFSTYLATIGYTDTTIAGFVNPGNLLLLLFAAILTMRLLAEERKMGTLELLLTSPVRDTEVIVGKFLGSVAVLCCMLILTLYYPLLLMVFGDPDMGPIWTSYLGLFLLGSAALAVGSFASSLSSNQIVAAVVAGGILFALWFVGIAADFVPEALAEIINYLSLSYHFTGFSIGLIDTRDIIYYFSVIVLFLYFAIRTLETSRWR